MPWLPSATPEVPAPEVSRDNLLSSEGEANMAPPPMSAKDLDNWQWEQYSLATGVAAELGFSVGKAESDRQSRVLVAEFSRSKSIPSSGGLNQRVGVAARLIVRVSGIKAGMNLTLPFVAAEAQFNRLEASAALHVQGYVGDEAGKLFPNFGSFDVESYVKLMDSLTALKNQISKDSDNVVPTQLWAWVPTAPTDGGLSDRLADAVGTVWALTCIARGWGLDRTVGEYRDTDDEPAHTAIRRTYREVVGDPGEGEPIPRSVREKADEWLDGYGLKGKVF